MSWAFEQQVEPNAKLVLLALANRSNNETGLCFPGQQLLGAECSMSDRTIRRHLKTLEAAGLVRRRPRMLGEGRGRTSDEYRLAFYDQPDRMSACSGPTGQTVRTNRTNQDDQPDKGDRVTVREPEENRKPVAAAPRKTDELWDTMLAVCGIDPTTLTRTARGAVNKALKELREIGATPSDLEAKAAAYRKTWPGMSLTPTALVKHWAQLATKADTKKRTCECGQPLDRHDDEFHTILKRGGL